MKHLISIVKRFIPKELPKPLGRWNTDYCDKKIIQKVDLSNEDHCGPCGQYVLNRRELFNSEDNKNIKKLN
jgi:hypothetical protein